MKAASPHRREALPTAHDSIFEHLSPKNEQL